MSKYLVTGDGDRLLTGDGAPLMADAPGSAWSEIEAAPASIAFTAAAQIAGVVALSAATALLSLATAATPSASITAEVAPAQIVFTTTASPDAEAFAAATITFTATAEPGAIASITPEPGSITFTAAAQPVGVAWLEAAPATITINGLPAQIASSAPLSAVPATITFTAAPAQITVNNAPKFRGYWLDAYAARQALLNAIDAANRLLAKTAGDAATANASAIVATNTRVDTVDGRVTAEADRVTVLDSRLTTAEGATAAQATAVNALTTRVTNAEGVNTAQAQSLTSISTTVGGHTASITQHATSINGLNLKAGIALDANGYVIGWELNNDGQSGSMTIVADQFRIIDPSASNSLTWDAGVQIARSGGYMKVTGKGFGVNGSLVDWYGPTMAVSACSTANSIYHMTNTGSAYFGGTLSAGVLKNAVQSSLISQTASVETGDFGTNGNSKVVVCSLSYQNIKTVAGDQGTSSNTTAATVTLQRSYNGGAWVTVGTVPCAGNFVKEYSAGDGVTSYNVTCAGSATFTDTTAGTAAFNYRATISAATGGWPITLNGDPGAQRLSILSTES